jgi:hypothetical protein
MLRKTLFTLSTLTIIYFCSMPPVQAAPVLLYTSRTTFNAASPGTTTLTFEGIAANGTLVSYNTSAGLTLNGVNFVGSYSGTSSNYYFLYVAGQGYVETGNAVLEGPPSRAPSINGNGYLRATLPGGTTSVGTDYRNVFSQDTSLYTDGMNVIVTTSDNQTQTFNLNATNVRQFAGFSVLTPGVTITSLQFSSAYNSQTGQRNYPVLDNFTFGQAPTPVPEPATLALLGSGLIGLAVTIRRKRKAKTLSNL